MLCETNCFLCDEQGDGKKKKAKFDKEYVLRFSALYFGPLKDSMVAYAERDAAGAKAAGGGGLPKVNKPFKGASSSSLYQVFHIPPPFPTPRQEI
jgi:hypothetical protein